MVPRLKEKYENDVLPALKESLGRPNRLSLPRLEKIIVNMGVGSAITEKKHLEESVSAMSQITGQKPVVTVARKAIAGFRSREGMPIGCKTTLRKQRMWEFMDRLISLAIPRVQNSLNNDRFLSGPRNFFVAFKRHSQQSKQLSCLIVTGH